MGPCLGLSFYLIQNWRIRSKSPKDPPLKSKGCGIHLPLERTEGCLFLMTYFLERIQMAIMPEVCCWLDQIWVESQPFYVRLVLLLFLPRYLLVGCVWLQFIFSMKKVQCFIFSLFSSVWLAKLFLVEVGKGGLFHLLVVNFRGYQFHGTIATNTTPRNSIVPHSHLTVLWILGCLEKLSSAKKQIVKNCTRNWKEYIFFRWKSNNSIKCLFHGILCPNDQLPELKSFLLYSMIGIKFTLILLSTNFSCYNFL